jgi:hypothetical protein
MTARSIIVIAGVTILSMTAGVHAQTTTKTKKSTGSKKVTGAHTITGAVVSTEGDWLLVRMQPSGLYQVYHVQPGRQFFIDGQPKLIGDLKAGTVLTATVVTHSQPVTERTTTVTDGTVWYVSGNYVIVTLTNGEQHEYTVPESYKFTVEGKPASVKELRKGMKVSATKIVEQPKSEISTTTVVTGKAAK